MAESENYKKGTAVRRKLMGAATADKMAKTVYDDPAIKKQLPMAALIRQSLDSAAPRPQSQYYGDISTGLQREFSPPNSVNPNSTPAAATDLITSVLKGNALL